MARTGKALEAGFVRELIFEAAEKEGIYLSEDKLDVINTVLKTLPSNPNPTWLIRWYGYKTKKKILQCPQYKLEAKILCTAVYKEIFYFLNKSEFDRLAKLLISDPPSKIEPQWIRNNAYALSISIKRRRSGVRTIYGEIDWVFVFNKLGAKNFSYRKLIPRNGDKNKIIQALISLLEDKNPRTFHYNWIERHCEAIAKQLRLMFKGDWSAVISLLDEKWQKRWRYYGPVKPIDWHENEKEFNKLILKHSQKLYLLYTDTKADRELRSQILLDFIFIAQKGNLLARNLLIDSIKLTIYVNEGLSDWHKFNGLLEEKIERCIMQFDLVKGDDFYSYIYKSIRLFTLPFAKLNAFSVNQAYWDYNQETSEFLLTQAQTEEAEDFIANIKLALIDK